MINHFPPASPAGGKSLRSGGAPVVVTSIWVLPPKTGIIVVILVLILGGKGREKRGENGEKSEKEN